MCVASNVFPPAAESMFSPRQVSLKVLCCVRATACDYFAILRTISSLRLTLLRKQGNEQRGRKTLPDFNTVKMHAHVPTARHQDAASRFSASC
jgi:hypothetical protein